MIVHDLGKSALLGLVVVGLVVMVLAGRAELADAMPVFTMIVGYLVGNGVNAVRRKAPSPVLVGKVQSGELDELRDDVRHVAGVVDGLAEQVDRIEGA